MVVGSYIIRSRFCYRQVIKEAWVAEERQRLRMPTQRYFTYEAATHLIPLLDMHVR